MNGSSSNNLGIILGAGASHACGTHAPERDDQCPPPLAKEVFAPAFDDILGRYPQLVKRVPEVRMRLVKGENIEEILRGLYDSAQQYGKYWPFQIPIYLRHLFWIFSRHCEHGGTNFDILVRPILESSIGKVMFLSLNYDLLLDSAIASCENWKFETLDSYLPEDKKWFLFKPHGSVNWAREIDNCPSDHAFGYRPFDLNETPHFSQDMEIKLVKPSWPHPYDYYVPGSGIDGYLYPQIVIPADKPKEFACPNLHTEQAKAFLKGCTNFLFIGFSGHDDDIASLLGMMPRGSRLMIVGMGEQDAQGIFQTMCSRAPELVRKDLVPSFYNDGFSTFIESEAFETYLTCIHVSPTSGAA
jgi:hypothetical protein